MNRRTFIKKSEQLTAGALCCTVPAWLTGCASLPYVAFQAVGNQISIQRADLLEYPFVLVDVSGYPNPLFLYQVGPDQFVSMLLRCTHKGCQPNPSGERLVCPCHGSEFSLTGAVLSGPAEEPLLQFATTSNDTEIKIILPETI